MMHHVGAPACVMRTLLPNWAAACTTGSTAAQRLHYPASLGCFCGYCLQFFLNYVITRAFMLNLVRLLMPRECAVGVL